MRRLEQSVIDLLAGYGIEGARQAGMPGVYVGGAKIAAVGLRVSRGCSFHGISLNVDAGPRGVRAASTPAATPGSPPRGSPTWGCVIRSTQCGSAGRRTLLAALCAP